MMASSTSPLGKAEQEVVTWHNLEQTPAIKIGEYIVALLVHLRIRRWKTCPLRSRSAWIFLHARQYKPIIACVANVNAEVGESVATGTDGIPGMGDEITYSVVVSNIGNTCLGGLTLINLLSIDIACKPSYTGQFLFWFVKVNPVFMMVVGKLRDGRSRHSFRSNHLIFLRRNNKAPSSLFQKCARKTQIWSARGCT